MLTAVIPARNEAASLPGTIASLRAQTVPPDRIIVAPNNCTDDTAEVARALGVEVFEVVANRHRKAGALNQALTAVQSDLVLILDADTRLAPTFVQRALQELLEARVGAVGGVFTGRSPRNLVELAQAAEYSRYAEQIDRTGRVSVLSGTAAVIRMEALREVARARGDQLPGRRGDIYDRDAWTEDSELTMALKSLNWQLRSPIECRCDTELMPSVGQLHTQRVRWYRGAIENVLSYGLTRVSLRYWLQQLGLAASTLIFWVYLLLTGYVIATGQLGFSPFWTAVGAVFWIEQQLATRLGSTRERLLALLMLPEMAHAIQLQLAFAHAVGQVLRKSEGVWHSTDLTDSKQAVTL